MPYPCVALDCDTSEHKYYDSVNMSETCETRLSTRVHDDDPRAMQTRRQE